MSVEVVLEMLRTAMGSLIVIAMVVKAAPPELLAHTVQVWVVMFTMGVPLMAPDVESKDRPAAVSYTHLTLPTKRIV